ncbi:unnamed protein product [Cuscuta epithymum]|uniref:Pentatricopeptide repeat-containing protein n=1 Tax=Cuscuta epithymum TaxID=186058 RepID=A0AAV0D8V1_9ASTE|nr:unnamed protein product [Cuscuta epithymum]
MRVTIKSSAGLWVLASTPMTRHCHTSSAATSLHLLHLLQLSIDYRTLKLTQQCHARIHCSGLTQHSVLATKLISAYSTCQSPFSSQLFFDSFVTKNVYIYNTLINGLAKNRFFVQSIRLFEQMCGSTVSPDEFTSSSVVKILAEAGDFMSGKMVHSMCVKNGFLFDIVVANSFMSLYVKNESLSDALKLFDEMPTRNLGSWNVIILGYVRLKDKSSENGLWEFVKEMKMEGWDFDAFTVSTLLSFCVEDRKTWHYGRELHCHVFKKSLNLEIGISGDDHHLGCCLIDIYSKSGRVNPARKVFEQLTHRNVFAWTSIVNGYVQNSNFKEACQLFFNMQVEGITPNKVSLVCILPACSSMVSLKGGKQVHGFAIRQNLNKEVSFSNALVDMYFRTGSFKSARLAFEHGSTIKDRISWSSMILGYGLHGKGHEAISMFNQMLNTGIKPDMITAVGALSACARSGLVDEGIKIFDSALNDYGVKPSVEMCSCMVDLFGRSGQLDRALEFITSMPVGPGPSIWGALLNASTLHGNDKMQMGCCFRS